MHIPPLRAAVAAAFLVLSAVAARADVLELVSGELVAGKPSKIDDAGVDFVPDKGGSMRVAWERVVPRCRYELTKGSLAADDAAGRVALAKWGVGAGLWQLARRDLLEAKGLSPADAAGIDTILADLRRAEADAAIEAADALVERGDPDKALERVKAYLRTADPGPDADRVRAKVPDLVARIERRDEEQRQAEEDRKKAEKDGKLKEWADRTLKAADQKKAEAGEAAADGFAWIAKGNQSRARDALVRAESKYQGARADYVRLRKALKEGPVADECAERARDCDDRTVEVLVRSGRLEVQNKAWKPASAIVDRGLRIDPVNRELLDLRAEIDRNWIRRKLSDTTNAKGRESSM